jgi:tetrahedral aminopeptidase
VVVHGREDLVGVMGSKPVHLMSDADKRSAPKLEDSVQEEVGLRGARVATARVRPDIGLAIDTTLANDAADSKPHERITTLGGGAAVKVYDMGTIVPRRVVEHLVAVAQERAIPHQIEVLARGSTDTRELALSGHGAPAGCVSIPTRYIHQVVETCHPGDIDACVSLVTAFCETAQTLLEADLSRT